MNQTRAATVASVILLAVGVSLELIGVDRASALATLAIGLLLLIVLRRQGHLLRETRRTRRTLEGDVMKYARSTFKRVLRFDRVDPDRLSSGTNTPKTAKPDARAGESSPAQSPQQPAAATRPLTGRASTPEVHNPTANESLSGLLTQPATLNIAGVLDASILNTDEARTTSLRPGIVVEQLESSEPHVVILDESHLGRGQWYGLFQASGTRQMIELLAGVQWAADRGIPVFVLPGASPPDVNTHALRESRAVVLPINDQQMMEAAGADQSVLFRHLQDIARTRKAS